MATNGTEVLAKNTVVAYPTEFQKFRERKNELGMTWNEFIVYLNNKERIEKARH